MTSDQARAWCREVGGEVVQRPRGYRVRIGKWSLSVNRAAVRLSDVTGRKRFEFRLGEDGSRDLAVEWVRDQAARTDPLAIEDWLARRR